MTDRVLTDQEIERIALASQRTTLYSSASHMDFARAVEAAVLAKVYAVAGGKPITEYVARRRERVAFDRGHQAGSTGVSCSVFREGIYPLPACNKCGQVLP